MAEAEGERPQEPGPDRLWTDSWYFDFSSDEPALAGGFLRLGWLPHLEVAWLWAACVVEDRVVLVRDDAVPLPRRPHPEIRATGLWADLVCETPLTHWTVGLEAFGLEFADPREALASERGDRVPVGLELEWEAAAPPFHHPLPAGRAHTGHYQHVGRVSGRVLVGDASLDFDGWGERDRFWGVRDWWDVGWHWAAFRLGEGTSMSVARPDVPGGTQHGTGYLALDGEDAHPILQVAVETQWDADGMPQRASYRLEGGEEIEAHVVALAPLLVPRPGEPSGAHLIRALCRFDGDRGAGTGWAEWLSPGG